MATSKIKKKQLENLQIVDADVAAAAAIALSKLLNGDKILLSNGTVIMIANFDMNNNRIINLAAPVNPNDAARKIDVDNAAAGLSGKDAVRVATTANISLTGAQTIDGISVVAGDRVLVKNQTTASANGIYVCATGAWSRASDADAAGELKAGSFVFVSEGTTNADSGWMISTDGAITIGSTAINWVQFSGAGQIIAGAGMTKLGNTLDIGTASVARIVVNADSIDLATTAVTPGTYQGLVVDAYGRVTGASNQSYLTIANFVNCETPAGTKNGTNTAFTLAFTPIVGTEQVYLNGALQERGIGNDYTISGVNITMLGAPVADDKLVVSYFK